MTISIEENARKNAIFTKHLYLGAYNAIVELNGKPYIKLYTEWIDGWLPDDLRKSPTLILDVSSSALGEYSVDDSGIHLTTRFTGKSTSSHIHWQAVAMVFDSNSQFRMALRQYEPRQDKNTDGMQQMQSKASTATVSDAKAVESAPGVARDEEKQNVIHVTFGKNPNDQ